jgi:hypothetical protein
MYDARVDVKKIIQSIILLHEMLDKLRIKRSPDVEDLALQCCRRLQSQLSNFKNENKIFKAKFLFDNIDYYNWTLELEDQLTSGEFYI